jgi:PBP1b-binding outer membrane lipoprotein LpoB
MKELLRNILILILAASVFYSCSSEEENVAPSTENRTEPVLISADTFLIRTAGDLATFLESGGLSGSADALQYGAVIYKVVYRTKYKGEDINASGLVIMPVTDEEVDMLSFQHGTITDDAPKPIKSGATATSPVEAMAE